MALLRTFRWLGATAIQQIFPTTCAIVAEVIQRQRMCRSERSDLPLWDDESLALSLDELKESHQLELDRRIRLENKAQVNLSTAALASSFGLGFMALLPKQAEIASQMPYAASFAALALGACGYLALSAACAGRAYGVSRTHNLFLQERLTTKKYGLATEDGNRKAQLISMIKLNQGFTLIVANFAAASGVALRNGIVLLLSAIAWNTMHRFVTT